MTEDGQDGQDGREADFYREFISLNRRLWLDYICATVFIHNINAALLLSPDVFITSQLMSTLTL